MTGMGGAGVDLDGIAAALMVPGYTRLSAILQLFATESVVVLVAGIVWRHLMPFAHCQVCSQDTMSHVLGLVPRVSVWGVLRGGSHVATGWGTGRGEPDTSMICIQSLLRLSDPGMHPLPRYTTAAFFLPEISPQ